MIVIVEGLSDQLALNEVARRLGRDLEAEGVSIVPIGGAHGIARFLAALARDGSDVRLAGLCDAREEIVFRKALESSGRGVALDREQMERLGFFVCTADLEDELIRALGVASAVKVIEAQGDLQPWQTFQKQPAQRGRSTHDQLRRFVRSISGRNPKYVRAFIEALEPSQIPRPLRQLLAYV